MNGKPFIDTNIWVYAHFNLFVSDIRLFFQLLF